MFHVVDNGSTDDEVRRQAKRFGDTATLAELDKAPKLLREASFYYLAFFELDTERNHGQGVAKIPRSKIVEFAEDCDLNEDEKFELIYIIRQMDDAHTERLINRAAANAPNVS